MSSALKTQFDPSWNEADQLISILRRWGITNQVGDSPSASCADGESPTWLAAVRQLL